MNIDNIPEREYSEASEHPTPLQLLLRLAIENVLSYQQRRVWAYYNYDRMSFTDIGKKLKISKQAVEQRIKVIERKLHLFCQEHRKVYKLLTKETQ